MVDAHTQAAVPAWRVVMFYIMTERRALALLFLVAGIFGAVLAVFFLYHCMMAYKGFTTNESFKWDDCKNLHAFAAKCHDRYVRLEAAARARAGAGAAPHQKEGEVRCKHEDLGGAKNDDDDVGSGDSQSDATISDDASFSPDIDGGAVLFAPSPEADTTFKVLREFLECIHMPVYCKDHPGEFPENSPYRKSLVDSIWHIVSPPSLGLLEHSELLAGNSTSIRETNAPALQEKMPKGKQLKKPKKKRS